MGHVWSENHEDVIQSLLQAAQRYKFLHTKAAEMYKLFTYLSYAVSGFFSAASGITVFAYSFADHTIPRSLKFLVGAFNVVGLGVSSASTKLAPDAKRQDHESAKDAFSNIIRNIKFELKYPQHDRMTDGETFVHETISDWNHTLQSTPKIPHKLAVKFAREVEQTITKPPPMERVPTVDATFFLDSSVQV